MAADGSDLARPMVIDFFVAVPDEPTGRRVAEGAAALGFDTSVERDDDSGDWTCDCAKRMVPTYDGVVEAQAQLDGISRPLGGRADGWGTFGNA
jgi:hypothetical protein